VKRVEHENALFTRFHLFGSDFTARTVEPVVTMMAFLKNYAIHNTPTVGIPRV
jgi:hypothetical protein